MDSVARLVCDVSECVLVIAGTDVASLWSAARVQQFLSENGNRDRLRLVLNRFRKLAGFQEKEAEAAAGLKLLWKIPGHYAAAANAIDRGAPLFLHDRSEMARSFSGLAEKLTETEVASKRPLWSMFKIG
jgi:Flp pilus assembly CpaE family ATPase